MPAFVRLRRTSLGGGIGRHAGLKILCFHERTGSSPVPGTHEAEKSLLDYSGRLFRFMVSRSESSERGFCFGAFFIYYK